MKVEPETQTSALIGTTLDGAYRITRLVAQGGMSAIYEAIQLRLHQRVAIKVMARELASNREALGRFHREAEVTSRLRHPHLVAVSDFGTAPADQPYLVMEYLEGIDLEHRIRQTGRLSLPSVVHIARQVASALAAAHEQGVVHRDLKPANVFLLELPGEPDFVKVLDFGISKVRAASTQLTNASSIIGTPNYMSPEQATGMLDEIDHRTDQWALACIVWEMLSGRPPFVSDEMSAVFYQITHLDPPPLGKRVPGLPPRVESVLRRALAKSAADRYSSIRDFTDALASAAASPAEGRETCLADAAPVERRRTRQERRRSDGSSDSGATRGAEPNPSKLRKLKPIHALSALAVSVAVAMLVPSRWPQPALSADATTGAAMARPAPMAVTPVSAALPSGAPGPVSNDSKSRKSGPDDPTGPRRRPVKAHPEPPGQALDAPSDPSAASGPASNRPSRKVGAVDPDFVDPFAPRVP